VLILLSPAKSLDYDSPLSTEKWSTPELLDHSQELVEVMATKQPDEIGQLMKISRALAETNFDRFQDWSTPFTPENARPALLAFHGDVYVGLNAPATFSERDFEFAQSSLRILSGLYGVLRPLDLMQPYRLEMGTKLATNRGADLYEFWGDVITDHLQLALEASPGSKVLVNLASNEYFKSVKKARVGAPIIAPRFLDTKDGQQKVIAMFAKRARGAMAAWMIKNRVRTVQDLDQFDLLGYRYDPEQSTETQPVYTRLEEDRTVAA